MIVTGYIYKEILKKIQGILYEAVEKNVFFPSF